MSLMISQCPKILSTELLKLFSAVESPTEEQQVAMLHLLHFSLQKHPTLSSLLTNILQTVKPDELSEWCRFKFLPVQELIPKPKFTKSERT